MDTHTYCVQVHTRACTLCTKKALTLNGSGCIYSLERTTGFNCSKLTSGQSLRNSQVRIKPKDPYLVCTALAHDYAILSNVKTI